MLICSRGHITKGCVAAALLSCVLLSMVAVVSSFVYLDDSRTYTTSAVVSTGAKVMWKDLVSRGDLVIEPSITKHDAFRYLMGTHEREAYDTLPSGAKVSPTRLSVETRHKGELVLEVSGENLQAVNNVLALYVREIQHLRDTRSREERITAESIRARLRGKSDHCRMHLNTNLNRSEIKPKPIIENCSDWVLKTLILIDLASMEIDDRKFEEKLDSSKTVIRHKNKQYKYFSILLFILVTSIALFLWLIFRRHLENQTVVES
jgi:hypothetical protein